uniref:Uncharacterized protein n=1 Tax=Arundo donax TaxID=35708 RepID=A0A0A9AWV1_ARUDO
MRSHILIFKLCNYFYQQPIQQYINL